MQDLTKSIKKQHIAIMGKQNWVWLGGIICFGKWEVTDKVPTACTDGKNVWYNPEFCGALSEPELRFIIIHEAMHKMAQHWRVYRAIHKLDAQRANAACDYWINNSIIKENNDSDFLKMPAGGLYNPKYHGKTVIEIFKDLEQYKSKDAQNQCRMDRQDADGNPITEGYPQGGGFDEHDWEGAELSDADRESIEKDIEIAIRQGRQLAGKMDGNKPRLIDEVLQGRVDWAKELIEFVKETISGRDETSWSKLNRRMFTTGYFPDAISKTMGRIAIAPDMSGSIGGVILGRFMGEIEKLCNELHPAGVDVLWWDTQVCGVQSFEQGQTDNLSNLLKPVGGGGTSPSCVAQWLDLNKSNDYECVVFLSDGYVDAFPVLNIPTLWVMTTDVVAEHGRTIKMEEF